jgi:phage terminase small subunit
VLDPRREKFCQLIVSGLYTHAEAYRTAYNKPSYNNNTANTKASELLKTEKVSNRISEIQEYTAKDAQISRNEIIKILIETVYKCLDDGKLMAVYRGIEILNKMHGYDKQEQPEQARHGGLIIQIDNGLSEEQLEALARARGLDV